MPSIRLTPRGRANVPPPKTMMATPRKASAITSASRTEMPAPSPTLSNNAKTLGEHAAQKAQMKKYRFCCFGSERSNNQAKSQPKPQRLAMPATIAQMAFRVQSPTASAKLAAAMRLMSNWPPMA